MKFKVILLFAVLIFGCSKKPQHLYGKWKLISSFYDATYNIIEQDDSIKAQILYYNDGTTQYAFDKKEPWYQFTNLKHKKNQYVDAIAGATKTGTQGISIESVHKDTLEVTSYILHKPLVEKWYRIK